MTSQTFQDLGLKPTTLAALQKRGFTHPTPIQGLAIPLLKQGEDLIAQAQTGTGKTLAFGLPVLEDTRGRGLQTLVLAPTRELANQIVDELNVAADGTKFKAFAIYGGVGLHKQAKTLERGDVTCLVACPGRLLDLLQRQMVDLRDVRHVILDEADRMLDMGFIRDIDRIFRYLPKERQTMLFSATVPPEVRKLAEKYLHKPESVRAETGPTATELTDQFRVRVHAEDKFATLLAVLAKEKPAKAVVFTRTKHGAKRLAKKLTSRGFRADALQGNLSQNARDRVMAAFRDDGFDILAATDVAARGLDVKGITHVINFDFPMVNEDYVHRIGRTGRAGERGRAFLFVERSEERDAAKVERLAGTPMSDYDVGPLPDVTEVAPTPAAGRPARGGGRNGGRTGGRPSGRTGGRSGGRSSGRSGGRGPRGNQPSRQTTSRRR